MVCVIDRKGGVGHRISAESGVIFLALVCRKGSPLYYTLLGFVLPARIII